MLELKMYIIVYTSKNISIQCDAPDTPVPIRV